MSHTHVSTLDEQLALGSSYTLLSAKNATLTLRNAEGITRSVIDLVSSYASVNFGHCNPAICFHEAQVDIAPFVYPEEAFLFADWLCSRLDLSTYRVLFQVGGSFGVTSALALAQKTRPGKIATIRGGFHGLGLDTIAVSTAQVEDALQNTALGSNLRQNVIVLSPGEYPKSWENISCLIYEPIQGANGYLPLDQEWLTQLHASAQQSGVITIADEIQCGFYRHGVLSPSRSMHLVPDILLFSKSMTNGLYPFSAVVYQENLENYKHGSVTLAHTFQTSALGCLAAWAVACFVDTYPIQQDIDRISDHFKCLEIKLQANTLVTAIHVTGPTLSFGLPSDLADQLVQQCFQKGVIILKGGEKNDRIRVAPPLTIPYEELCASTTILTETLATICQVDV